MIKKYLYAGLVLLVIGALVLYFVSSFITTGTPTSVTNVTVPGGRIGDVPIKVNSSAISIIFVFASNATDVYFLNQSTFGGLTGYLSGYASRSAYGYVESQNVSKTDIFLNATSAVKEDYQNANPGTGDYYVYAVIDSTDGSPSTNGIVNASVVYKAYSYSSWEGSSGEALIGVAAIILGIALLIYGAIKKPKVEVAPAVAAPEKPAPKKKGKKVSSS